MSVNAHTHTPALVKLFFGLKAALVAFFVLLKYLVDKAEAGLEQRREKECFICRRLNITCVRKGELYV